MNAVRMSWRVEKEKILKTFDVTSSVLVERYEEQEEFENFNLFFSQNKMPTKYVLQCQKLDVPLGSFWNPQIMCIAVICWTKNK